MAIIKLPERVGGRSCGEDDADNGARVCKFYGSLAVVKASERARLDAAGQVNNGHSLR